jgi:predicted component of type VI protein secretion system
MAFQVTVQYPNGQLLTFPFEKNEVYCGRAQGNDIRLAHSFVSSRHFRIRQQESRFYVEDVGSTNGTLLNGQNIEAHIPQPITPDDVIQLGSLEIRVASIVEATIIERISRPLPAGQEVVERLASRQSTAPIEGPTGDEPAPLWQIQTGMIRQQSAGIRIDDQSVSFPRREANEGASSYPRPGFEERIRRAPAPETQARQEIELSVPWGTLSQMLGGVLLLAAIGLMLIVLFL